MALIRLVDLDEPDGDVLEVVEAGRSAYGTVLETWRAIAHNPAVLNAYLPYVRAVFGPGHLDQRTKDLVAIRVCLLNGCRYSLSHRVASARRQGICDVDIEALGDPDGHDFSARERVALACAEELTLAPPKIAHRESRQVLSPETVAAVKTAFSDEELNDLVTTVAVWNMLTRYHRVLELDLDMPPPPAALDATV